MDFENCSDEIKKRYNGLSREQRRYADALLAASKALIDYGEENITHPYFEHRYPVREIGETYVCHLYFNVMDETGCIKTKVCKISDLDTPDYI